MTSHHPSAETLLDHASGALPTGLALVVAAHLDGCSACAETVRHLEAVGGALMAELDPAALAEGAFNQVLARLDDPRPVAMARTARPARNPLPEGMRLPPALRGARIGPWRWVGRGIRFSRIRLPWAPDQMMMLLRVRGGRRVLHHSHGGAEFTQVLAGGFSDHTGHYQAGDFAEADDSCAHQPVADAEGCICLAALDGGLRLPWLTRLLGR